MTREFDIVVFGATGFVGKLTARHLAIHGPANVRVALAGRSESKLSTVRSALGARAAQWPLIIADSDDPASLDALCARTRVVITTVGPYLRYGENLVAAAATAGTSYVDLTGEAPFVRWSIDKFTETAQASGAKIVHACGFDAIPSDLGTYLDYLAVTEAGEGELADTATVVQLRGTLSGGTIDSMRVLFERIGDRDFRQQVLDPRLLNDDVYQPSDLRSEPLDLAPIAAKSVDPSLRGRLAPFFMSTYNTRIVRRTAAIVPYGPRFRYREGLSVGSLPVVSDVAALAVTGGTVAGAGAFAIKPVRALLNRVLPKPGQGPSERTQQRGSFTSSTYAHTTTGARFVTTIHADKDPAYSATAVMLAESALSLVLGGAQLPTRTGVLTPAAALGTVLRDRLIAAGFDISTRRLR